MNNSTHFARRQQAGDPATQEAPACVTLPAAENKSTPQKSTLLFFIIFFLNFIDYY